MLSNLHLTMVTKFVKKNWKFCWRNLADLILFFSINMREHLRISTSQLRSQHQCLIWSTSNFSFMVFFFCSLTLFYLLFFQETSNQWRKSIQLVFVSSHLKIKIWTFFVMNFERDDRFVRKWCFIFFFLFKKLPGRWRKREQWREWGKEWRVA